MADVSEDRDIKPSMCVPVFKLAEISDRLKVWRMFITGNWLMVSVHLLLDSCLPSVKKQLIFLNLWPFALLTLRANVPCPGLAGSGLRRTGNVWRWEGAFGGLPVAPVQVEDPHFCVCQFPGTKNVQCRNENSGTFSLNSQWQWWENVPGGADPVGQSLDTNVRTNGKLGGLAGCSSTRLALQQL